MNAQEVPNNWGRRDIVNWGRGGNLFTNPLVRWRGRVYYWDRNTQKLIVIRSPSRAWTTRGSRRAINSGSVFNISREGTQNNPFFQEAGGRLREAHLSLRQGQQHPVI